MECYFEPVCTLMDFRMFCLEFVHVLSTTKNTGYIYYPLRLVHFILVYFLNLEYPYWKVHARDL